MPGLGEFAQKAFYFGLGLASVAADKATGQFTELRQQAQKTVDELVARGAMTAAEAQSLMESFSNWGSDEGASSEATPDPGSNAPRQIQIEDEDEADDSLQPNRWSSDPHQGADVQPLAVTPEPIATDSDVKSLSVDALRARIAGIQDQIDHLQSRS